MADTYEGIDSELLETRIKQDEEAYEKIGNIIQKTLKSNKYGLPFLPAYFNFGTEEQTWAKIQRSQVMQDARINEFCLERCAKEGPSCMNLCSAFAKKMHIAGQSIFFKLQREYATAIFTPEEEE